MLKAVQNHKKPKSKKKRAPKLKFYKFPPLPETFNVSLVSTYRWNTTVSAGAVTTATVNLSDLNEFSPYYYDQLMTIYRNWIVVGVDIEYRIVNRSVSYDGELIFCELNRKNFDSGLTFPIAESLPRATRVICPSTGNNKTFVARRHLNLSYFYKNGFRGDSNFWGDLYNSPPITTDLTNKDNMYSLVMYSSADGTNGLSFTTDRRITFHVSFFNFWASNISSYESPIAEEDCESHPPKKDSVQNKKETKSIHNTNSQTQSLSVAKKSR